MKYLPQLFARNRAWADRNRSVDPLFFERLCDIQRPDYLWIGCADSRVPANEIVGLAPGELFVHRNVANLVAADDPNCMAVLQYAVENLGVEHVIVCGHYGCGGVGAALDGGTAGWVDEWLSPLRTLASTHADELRTLPDRAARWRRFCEINVIEQVRILTETDVLTRAWQAGRRVVVHGWIYDLHDGLLRDLDVSVTGPGDRTPR